jgi:hypothetical protein
MWLPDRLDDRPLARRFGRNLRDGADAGVHPRAEQPRHIITQPGGGDLVPAVARHDQQRNAAGSLLNNLIVPHIVAVTVIDKEVIRQASRSDHSVGRGGQALGRAPVDRSEQRETAPAGAGAHNAGRQVTRIVADERPGIVPEVCVQRRLA